MKKTYMKPRVSFEDFSLNTSIAAGCERITENHKQWECAVQFGPDIIFGTEMTLCEYKISLDDYDFICYHNPTTDNNLFNS